MREHDHAVEALGLTHIMGDDQQRSRRPPAPAALEQPSAVSGIQAAKRLVQHCETHLLAEHGACDANQLPLATRK
jgi:hypothetical protein